MPELDPPFAAAVQKVLVSADSVIKPPMRDGISIHDAIPVPVDGDALVESLPAVTVLRTSDLVNLTFRFVNLTVTDGDPPVLVRERVDAAAFLIAVFGPQHLLEEAFFDAGGKPGNFIEGETPQLPGGSEPPHYPVQAILARTSRLAFRVTDQRIPWSASGLLDVMGQLPLNVVPHAESEGVMLNWFELATDVGALQGPSKLVTRLTAASRRRERMEVEAGAALSARAVAARRRAARDRASVAASGLAELATQARQQRTALELEARFGAHIAVSAVADAIAGELIIPPIRIVGRKPPLPRAPRATETAIELPWRLSLSPHGDGAFAHSADEVEHGGRIELWHTRLGTRAADSSVNEGDPATRTVRAVWTREFDAVRAGVDPLSQDAFPRDEDDGDARTLDPFRASLSRVERMQIVHLTSNHHWKRARSWSPAPVTVHNLMLTALGGWLDSEVHFDDGVPPGLSIEEWKHRATMGRDQFVKVVKQGVLLPFGHRAAVIKITERRVAPGDTHATLYQRLFVVVREPQRSYLATRLAEFDNVMPFRWVRILTAATPPLALPTRLRKDPEHVLEGRGQIFVPEIATLDTAPTQSEPASQRPFHFRMLANDVDNHLVEFEGPLIFVEKILFEGGASDKNAEDARLAANRVSPSYPLRGQRIAYAKPADPDDTTLSTAAITFDAKFDTTAEESKRTVRNFVLPVMRVASAAVPAMSAFTGQSDPQQLRYADAYRKSGFTPGNDGGIFLELANSDGSVASSATTMGFHSQADRSGGFVTPSVDVAALARRVGPVGGDLTKLAATPATFDVRRMFQSKLGKLFGILPLADLLPASGGPLPVFVAQSVSTTVALQQAIGEAHSFITTHAVELGGQSPAVQQAALELEARATDFADAVVKLAQSAHAPPDLTGILRPLCRHAGVLQAAFDDPASSIGLPRPVVERAQALLSRLAVLESEAGNIAADVHRFYEGKAVPEVVNARLDWETPLEAWSPPGITQAVFLPGGDVGGDTRLRLSAEIQAPLGGGPPTALIACSLPRFDLKLMGDTPFITVRVAVMEFSVRPGHKPDVNVRLDGGRGIEFGGPLAFVETLREIIPFDGFSDPPYVDISTSGLRTGFDLAVPDLPMGIFALTNIHLGAELVVPFIGESLEFRFFFATREDPFRLQVAFFAGGGFFAITISPKGLKVIEASFEFGAAVEMTFVVASGSLSVMAGIYFRLEFDNMNQNVQLTGYFRARGEVDVLGLISACIELYLALSFRSPDKAVGMASISVEVSVCFASFSVSVSCEKQFSGSAGDPTFAEMMDRYTDVALEAHDPWLEYCQAFAIEAV